MKWKSAQAGLQAVQPFTLHGRVAAVRPLGVEIVGLGGHLAVGDRAWLAGRDGGRLLAEIVSAEPGKLHASPFGRTQGLGAGADVQVAWAPMAGFGGSATVRPAAEWLGRAIDPLGEPADGLGPLAPGPIARPVRAAPPPAIERARLGAPIDLGVRALNCFATCRTGQRLGLFAGSGVGKSTLMSMLARHTACDVAVLALVGERGREVREFIEDDLGPEGMARSVVVVATSDSPPLMRREAAYTAMAVAEHFRDEGKSVLLMMDSVTRFCLALREIGLAAGEPPATRGYPPSVFAELPGLLERAGPGPMRPDGSAGQITALFTVLVEGDDHDEPVADAVRGILDGHVVLDRRIGEGGRYPAIDVLRSLSRAAHACLSPEQAALVREARAMLSLHAEMADMVRLGAARAGADPALDAAMLAVPRIEAMLTQGRHEASNIEESFAALHRAVRGP